MFFLHLYAGKLRRLFIQLIDVLAIKNTNSNNWSLEIGRNSHQRRQDRCHSCALRGMSGDTAAERKS